MILLFLSGTPFCGLSSVAEHYSNVKSSNILVRHGLDIGGVLERLEAFARTTTQRQSQPWAAPEVPEWVGRSVREFGQLLVRSSVGKSEGLVVIAHPENSRHIDRLMGTFSRTSYPFKRAAYLLIVRDGLVVPRVPLGDARSQALSGLAWAQIWASAIDPGMKQGIPVVRREDLDESNGEMLVRLGQTQTVQQPLPQTWENAKPGVRLTGPAAQGFAASCSALRWMKFFGYSVPEEGVLNSQIPELVVAKADGLIEEGALEKAAVLLSGALAKSRHPLLLVSEGKRLASLGDEDGAMACWSECIREESAPVAAWLLMLSRTGHAVSRDHIARARQHPDEAVRGALARWLVARGMDHGAAQAIAGVEGRVWSA